MLQHPLRRPIRFLASLRLTVILMALSMFLIFAGTLAQVGDGIWTVMAMYFRTLVAWIPLQLFIPREVAETPLRFPFPGGFLLGGLLLLNLLAAHVSRFKASWKRSGIIVVHLGIIALLASEFVTGLFATEGLMTIDEGASSSHVEDIREVELVFLEAIEEGRERVIAVPESLLIAASRGDEGGGSVAHHALPFDVVVHTWMPNSALESAELGTSPDDGRFRATEGSGLRWAAEPRPRTSGLDGQVDAPSAMISLRREGDTHGTWLVSLHLNPVQVITVDGREYRFGIRFKRTYKPYTLHLLEFRHDRFVGTERPRNFSSRIRLVDPMRDVDREVLIRMNRPLRYAGATFYQSAYKEGDVGTILQVVRNPGQLLPYIACAMVGIGLLGHFGLRLSEFLRRSRRTDRAGVASEGLGAGSGSDDGATGRSSAVPWVSVAVVAAAIAFIAGMARGPGESAADPFDWQTFAAIPASADGRIKPLDTVARTNLMLISGRQSFSHDGEDRQPAIRWLADVMARPEDARSYRIFRIDHPDVRQMIRAEPAGEDDERSLFTLHEIMPHWNEILGQAQRAVDIPARQRDPFQRHILRLYRQVVVFMELSQMRTPYMVPPTSPDGEWAPFFRLLHDSMIQPEGTRPPAAVSAITGIMSAYHQDQPEVFNERIGRYRAAFAEHMPETLRRAEFEVFFNRFRPFYQATAMYVTAFLLVCGSLLLRGMVAPAGQVIAGIGSPGASPRTDWAGALARAGFWLIIITFMLHTFGLAGRMYLQGRPPVTNLYSSAIFVGWGTVLLALLVERIHKLGLASLGASAIGAGTLIIAHNLAGDGDTLEMMQAVLDSNFWLSTHVITITIGYSATFLAGFLGIVYILSGLLPCSRTQHAEQSLSKMIYGTICFALLFSFVGTVLGGIWADQSWGRFWGWDPKENGAALIVLLHAIVLHARWGGMIRTHGIAVLAVGGNIVTAWAWFGTNMLGVGLHSYGFMESAVFWLMAFIVSQFAIMALGMMGGRDQFWPVPTSSPPKSTPRSPPRVQR